MALRSNLSTCIIVLLILLQSCKSSLYLSDTDPYYSRIENIQEAELTRLKIDPSIFTKQTSRKEIKKILKETEDTLCKNYGDEWCNNKEVNKILGQTLKNKLTTRYEHPLTYWYTALLLNEVQKSAVELGYSKRQTKSLKLGTILSNRTVAEAQPFNEQYLILAHQRFYIFCYHMLKLCHLPLDLGEIKDNKIEIKADSAHIDASITNNKKILEEFTYSTISFLYNLKPYNIHLPGFEKSLITLTQAMEVFVLSHEFAHSLKKHTTSIIDEASYTSDEIKILRKLKSWRNEFEADVIGYKLTQNSISNGLHGNKNGLEALQMYGPLIYMHSLNVLEKGEQIIKDSLSSPVISTQEIKIIREVLESELSNRELIERSTLINKYWLDKDHPPTQTRAAYMYQFLQKDIQEARPKLSEDEQQLIQIGSSLIYAMNQIYNKSEFAFYKWYSYKHLINK